MLSMVPLNWKLICYQDMTTSLASSALFEMQKQWKSQGGLMFTGIAGKQTVIGVFVLNDDAAAAQSSLEAAGFLQHRFRI